MTTSTTTPPIGLPFGRLAEQSPHTETKSAEVARICIGDGRPFGRRMEARKEERVTRREETGRQVVLELLYAGTHISRLPILQPETRDLLVFLASAFRASHSGVRVAVTVGGISSKGIRFLRLPSHQFSDCLIPLCSTPLGQDLKAAHSSAIHWKSMPSLRPLTDPRCHSPLTSPTSPSKVRRRLGTQSSTHLFSYYYPHISSAQ